MLSEVFGINAPRYRASEQALLLLAQRLDILLRVVTADAGEYRFLVTTTAFSCLDAVHSGPVRETCYTTQHRSKGL